MLSNQNITASFSLCQRIFENNFPKYCETENPFQLAQKRPFPFLHFAESAPILLTGF
jgi:hypothetical protein